MCAVTGWSAPLLFAYSKNSFSHDVAYMYFKSDKYLTNFLGAIIYKSYRSEYNFSCPLTPVVSKASSGVAEIMNILTVGSSQSTQKFIKVMRKLCTIKNFFKVLLNKIEYLIYLSSFMLNLWNIWENNDDKQQIKSYDMGRVKRICVFEHSVMTNFNCACPVIQRGQGSGFLSEGSSWLTACMSEQRRFWRDCADAQARLNLRCSHRR